MGIPVDPLPKDFVLSHLLEAPVLWAQTKKLIEDQFPRGAELSQPAAMEDEFPLLLSKGNHNRCWIVHTKSNSTVAAVCCYRIFEVRVPRCPPLQVAALGLIVTAPEFRGRGFSRFLQRECLKRARREGAAVAVLWSDLLDFYTKLGFTVAGTEWQWNVDKSQLPALKQGLEFELQTKGAPCEIETAKNFATLQDLYVPQQIGPVRRSSDYEKFLGLPNTFGWVAFDEEMPRPPRTKPIGYALMGKGRDLRDTIHELIGQPESVAPLLRAALEKAQNGLKVQQPITSTLKGEISKWLGEPEKTPLAFFKTLSLSKVVDYLSKAGRAGWWPRDLQITFHGTSHQPWKNQENEDELQDVRNAYFELARDGRVFFQSDDPTHALQLFFGPWTPPELEGLPPLVQEGLRGIEVPMPIYFWGFDSV